MDVLRRLSGAPAVGEGRGGAPGPVALLGGWSVLLSNAAVAGLVVAT